MRGRFSNQLNPRDSRESPLAEARDSAPLRSRSDETVAQKRRRFVRLRDVIDHHRRSGRIATALAGVSHHIFSDRLLMLQNSARDQHRFSRDLTTDTMNRLPSFARSEHSHQCDPFMSSGPSWSAWCRRWAHSKSGTAWAGAWSGQEGAGWRWDAETAFGRGAVPCCVLASVRGGVRAAERSRARDGGRVV
jgi:hypothetical protein